MCGSNSVLIIEFLNRYGIVKKKIIFSVVVTGDDFRAHRYDLVNKQSLGVNIVKLDQKKVLKSVYQSGTEGGRVTKRV